MKYLPVVFLLILVVSCDEKDKPVPSELVGLWQLSELLIDPGDGSGTFQPVDYTKTMNFKANGKVESSTPLCHPYREGDSEVGDYSIEKMTITPDCGEYELTLQMEFEGRYLIIRYLCFEQCAEKYERVD